MPERDHEKYRLPFTEDTERRRATFDEVAELYDRARPGYRPEIFDDLAALAGLGPHSRVLEIGCGTGQATVPLAERGCSIVAVEIGPQMVAVARRNLARFPRVEVVHAAFESWPLPSEPFDLVLSATAFHWIDPGVRVSKSADALRPGGTLATISTHHIQGGTESFFVEVQDCYNRWDRANPHGQALPTADAVPRDAEEIEKSDRFDALQFRRYEWEVSYSTAAYIDVKSTYSDLRKLAPDVRAGLLDCIARLIDARFGGHVVKRYLSELRVARSVAPR
jgi:SAM-dependent methyltransferase